MSELNNLAKQKPDKTNELFAKLMKWLDGNVKETYLPKENLNYEVKNEAHNESYINLVEVFRTGGNVALFIEPLETSEFSKMH
jgi:hypothetical protein